MKPPSTIIAIDPVTIIGRLAYSTRLSTISRIGLRTGSGTHTYRENKRYPSVKNKGKKMRIKNQAFQYPIKLGPFHLRYVLTDRAGVLEK